jgi:hypothetical protein
VLLERRTDTKSVTVTLKTFRQLKAMGFVFSECIITMRKTTRSTHLLDHCKLPTICAPLRQSLVAHLIHKTTHIWHENDSRVFPVPSIIFVLLLKLPVSHLSNCVGFNTNGT